VNGISNFVAKRSYPPASISLSKQAVIIQVIVFWAVYVCDVVGHHHFGGLWSLRLKAVSYHITTNLFRSGGITMRHIRLYTLLCVLLIENVFH